MRQNNLQKSSRQLGKMDKVSTRSQIKDHPHANQVGLLKIPSFMTNKSETIRSDEDTAILIMKKDETDKVNIKKEVHENLKLDTDQSNISKEINHAKNEVPLLKYSSRNNEGTTRPKNILN